MEENKENNNTANQINKGKNLALKEGGNIPEVMGGGRVMPKGGPFQKRADLKKINVANGHKPKQNKVSRPTRGLIFGPTNREITLS